MLTFLPLICTVWLYINKEENMAIQTTYTHARARLAFLLDEVTKNREVVIIQRRGSEDVAMIAADELTGILETAHLLRSPTNAERLLTALDRVRKRTGTPQTIDELRSEVGFE
jgi:antitoxin YefM